MSRCRRRTITNTPLVSPRLPKVVQRRKLLFPKKVRRNLVQNAWLLSAFPPRSSVCGEECLACTPGASVKRADPLDASSRASRYSFQPPSVAGAQTPLSSIATQAASAALQFDSGTELLRLFSQSDQQTVLRGSNLHQALQRAGFYSALPKAGARKRPEGWGERGVPAAVGRFSGCAEILFIRADTDGRALPFRVFAQPHPLAARATRRRWSVRSLLPNAAHKGRVF